MFGRNLRRCMFRPQFEVHVMPNLEEKRKSQYEPLPPKFIVLDRGLFLLAGYGISWLCVLA
jgi:hypothetical protein